MKATAQRDSTWCIDETEMNRLKICKICNIFRWNTSGISIRWEMFMNFRGYLLSIHISARNERYFYGSHPKECENVNRDDWLKWVWIICGSKATNTCSDNRVIPTILIVNMASNSRIIRITTEKAITKLLSNRIHWLLKTEHSMRSCGLNTRSNTHTKANFRPTASILHHNQLCCLILTNLFTHVRTRLIWYWLLKNRK